MDYFIEKRFIPGLVKRKLASESFIIAHESGNEKNTGPDAYLRQWGISIDQFKRDVEKGTVVSSAEQTVHIVSKGETLWSIAKIYHTTVESLKSWNGLKSDTIYPRDQLTVNKNAQTITNNKIPQPSKCKLFLPGNNRSWRVYAIGGNYTVGNETGYLAPIKFDGLTYDILAELTPNVYKIKTKNFGEVAIYAGRDTNAQIS